MRVDQNISASNSMFARYTIDDVQQTSPLSQPFFSNILQSRYQYATLSESHVFSPTLLNTIRFSLSRTAFNSNSPSMFSGPKYAFVPGHEVGTVNPGSGITTAGPTFPQNVQQNLFTLSDDLYDTRGRQSLKFGYLINFYRQYIYQGVAQNGTVTFADLTHFRLAQPISY